MLKLIYMKIKKVRRLPVVYFIAAILCIGFNKIGPGVYDAEKRLVVTDTSNPVSSFLVISDVHLNRYEKQALSDGDTDYDLWDSAKIEINKLLDSNNASKPKFVLVLGDLPFHVKDDLSDMDSVRNSFDTVYENLNAIANAAGVPLIIVPGNNDSYDGDYHQLNPDHYTNLFYPDSIASFADNSLAGIGVYSIYPLGKDKKLRLIVLNTVMFSFPKANKNFFYGTNRQLHTDLQMSWLRTQLQQVADSHETALIAMHIPPGNDGYTTHSTRKIYLWDNKLQFEGRPVQNAFLDIIDSFKINIAGLLSSHSHMDGIRLLMNNDSVSSLLISVPSITPGHKNNPSFKLVSFNAAKNYELEDFTTWYMQYWKNDKKVTNFSNHFSFINEFHCEPNTSMLSNIKAILEKNKNELNKDIDSIYTVKNGPPAATHNNAGVTIYVKKQ
jgi:sphingomyelin phosphodiesterase acid-like 3